MNLNETIIEEVFTEVEGGINGQLNKLTVKCFDSINNKFSMDCDGNLVVNSITTNVPINNGSTNMDSNLIDLFYPVGTYYETSNATFNPNNSWGGVWSLDTAGYVTVSQDLDQTEFSTIGKTGGSKYTENHTHNISIATNSSTGGTTEYLTPVTKSTPTTGRTSFSTAKFGTGKSGNLQPYIVVKRWHRIG